MSGFVTQEGYDKLLAEKKRAEEELQNALLRTAETNSGGGDYHENNFFEYLEEQIHHLKGKLADVKSRVERAKVTVSNPTDVTKVTFGCSVEVESACEKTTYKLLGEEDTDLTKNIISYQSPIGHALMDKSVNDEVNVVLPESTLTLKITKIFS